ncbi:MAG: leucine-rich repeat protein, partial [Acutalibacteraceae bacterium]|nr:leucine-rich repeat protein [Acutalibacteraceae bacterium]
MKIMQKGLAILLAAVMLFTVLPMGAMSAFAATEVDGVLSTSAPTNVVITEEGQEKYYSFTPEESGWYAFRSESVGDPAICLFDGDVLIAEGDDEEGYNFFLKAELEVGKTYVAQLRSYNTEDSFDVYVEKINPLTVESVVFHDLTIIEGYGAYDASAVILNDQDEEEEVFWKRYNVPYSYTVTYSDGTTEERMDNYACDDLGSYYFEAEDGQSYETPWGIGDHVVNVTIADLNISASFTVTIVPNPVVSVEIDTVYVIEDIDGYMHQDTIWNEETQEDEYSPEYFYYYTPYPSSDKVVISLDGGTVIEGDRFEYMGREYTFTASAPHQSYENQWAVGNTYVINANIGSYEFTYNAEVVKTPIVSITAPNKSFFANSNGELGCDEIWNEETQSYDYSPEYFKYNYRLNSDEVVISFIDGSEVCDDEFVWNDNYYCIEYDPANQSYENQWTGGNTYTVKASVLGFDFTYDVEIMASPIASVSVNKFQITENTDGYYTNDTYWDNELETQVTTPEYFYYYTPWPNSNNIVITLNNGDVIYNNWFEYNGQEFTIDNVFSNQDYEHRWTAGNTYTVTGVIAGFEFTYEIEILECPIASVVVQPITLLEGTNGVYTNDQIWNNETQDYDYSPEYFYYHTPWPRSIVVTFKTGETYDHDSFEHNGVRYDLTMYGTDQSYENQWTAGNTYTVEASIGGYRFTYDVNLIETPIVSVEVEDQVIQENTCGDWSCDEYWDEETEEYVTTPSYFCYWRENPSNVTVTLTNGEVFYGNEIEFEGEYYYINYDFPEQDYDNQWTAGNTYEVTGRILGYTFTYNIIIAQTVSNDSFEYVEGSDGIIITYSFLESETLEIPAEIDGKPVIGVVELGGSSSVKNLIFPDSVRTIGDYMLESFENLETVTFGDGIQNLRSYMFAYCYSLRSITVSENNKYFTTQDGVLYNKDVTAIVAVPRGREGAYVVPNTITEIDVLLLPEYSAIEIVFPDNHPNFVTVDGVTYNKDKTKIVFCSKSKAGSYDMPDTVTEIADGAFRGCAQLTEVKFSSQITDIVYCAFYSCVSLESVELPEGLVSIGDWAFYRTSALTDVDLPEGLEYIGWSAFNNSGLTSLKVPDSVEIIDSAAFAGSKITSVDLSNGIVEIYSYAFANTPVTSIVMPDSLEYLGAGAFYGCKNLTSATIGSGLWIIDDYTFEGSGLKSITIPENIEYIGEGAFMSSALESVTFTEGLDIIYFAAFMNCDKLTSVTLPESLSYIGGSAFCDCDNLVYVKLGDNIEFIGYRAFANCPIKNLDLGNSIIEIPGYGFENTDITEVFIPSGVTAIIYGAFMDCDKLTSVELPLSVEFIDYDSFSGCVNLTDVYYEGSEEDRNNMEIDPEGNEYLLNATWHYNWTNIKWDPDAVCLHENTTVVEAEPSTCYSNGHGKYTICNICDEVISGSDLPLPLLDHSFTNDCDGDCNTQGCDYTREVSGHEFSDDSDTTCNNCGTVVYPGGNTLVKENGVWYHVIDREKVIDTTLVQYNGTWYYVEDGVVDFTATTLVYYSGKMWFVKEGKLCRDNTLVYFGGVWYHVNGGNPVQDTTLVAYNGSMYYVVEGTVDFTATDLVEYNGATYYVQNGKVDLNSTAMVELEGTTYYVNKGKVDLTATGIVTIGDKQWYVKEGILCTDNTLVKVGNVWYHVNGGTVTNETTLITFEDAVYYVKDGKVDFTATTLVTFEGQQWYVKAGVVCTDNTLVNVGNVWYHVNGGTATSDTTLVQYNGTWYYVKGGKVEFTATTLVSYNGKMWFVKGGKMSRENTLVNFGGVWYHVNGGN